MALATRQSDPAIKAESAFAPNIPQTIKIKPIIKLIAFTPFLMKNTVDIHFWSNPRNFFFLYIIFSLYINKKKSGKVGRIVRTNRKNAQKCPFLPQKCPKIAVFVHTNPVFVRTFLVKSCFQKWAESGQMAKKVGKTVRTKPKTTQKSDQNSSKKPIKSGLGQILFPKVGKTVRTN